MLQTQFTILENIQKSRSEEMPVWLCLDTELGITCDTQERRRENIPPLRIMSLLWILSPWVWRKAKWRELQVESLMQERKVGSSWKVGGTAQIQRQSVQRNRKDIFTRNPDESDKNAPKSLRAAGVKTWLEERSHSMKTQRARPHLFSYLLHLQLSHSAELSSL